MRVATRLETMARRSGPGSYVRVVIVGAWATLLGGLLVGLAAHGLSLVATASAPATATTGAPAPALVPRALAETGLTALWNAGAVTALLGVILVVAGWRVLVRSVRR